MAKALLAWELGGGAGHCVKMLPIAAGLIARGYKVSMAARDLVTARQVFGLMEVNYFQAPYLNTRPPNIILDTFSFTHVLHNTGFGAELSLEVLCAAWRNLIAAADPQILVCDHAPMAMLASRGLRLRRVVVGTGFTLPPVESPFPDLRYWVSPPPCLDDLRREEELILGRINNHMSRNGLTNLVRLSDLYADVDARFLLAFRELDHYAQRNSEEYFGTWVAEDGAMPTWPEGQGPRVFAYLKPPARDWQLGRLLSFLREARLRTLVYVPGGNPAWLQRFQSPRMCFANQLINLREVAKQCDLAVLNGNSGSVAAFLLAGVPQLNVPLNLEQIVLSRRVVDLGAGLMANPTSPEQMSARLIAALQDARCHDAAKEFAARYSDYDSRQVQSTIVARICDLVST